jgi:hypothetical protein
MRLLEWLLEQIVQGCFKWMIDQAGSHGEVTLFLIVGLSLLIGGPLYMARENKRRINSERKPRYGWIEYIVVVSGGVVFAAAGLALLVTTS